MRLPSRIGISQVLVSADRVGLLTIDAIVGTPKPSTLIYCCGPEPLLSAVEIEAKSWPSGSLQVERFVPKEQTTFQPNKAFEVYLAESDVTVQVDGGESILDAIERVGRHVSFVCIEGTCGTCEARV